MTRDSQHTAQPSDADAATMPPDGGAPSDDRARLASRKYKAVAVGATATGTTAMGAVAIGALAVGAVAIGALAIGRLAIKRLSVRQSHFDRLERQPLTTWSDRCAEGAGLSLAKISLAIEPLRRSLLEHGVYRDLRSPAALRVFMQHHVFAVWDFMSLLKLLQQRLTCTDVPWIPNRESGGGRLINEIVVAEETDEDGRGGFASHFDLYRRAMVGFGADTTVIDGFLDRLRDRQPVANALDGAGASPAIQQFVAHTFDVIASGDLCRIAATFTFGREDLLPGLFQKIVDELAQQAGGGLDEFKYYLLRHVELDGDEHGPMAHRLIAGLCGTDEGKWRAAERAAVAALHARLALWDAIHRAVSGSG
jgi:hypothetical protein